MPLSILNRFNPTTSICSNGSVGGSDCIAAVPDVPFPTASASISLRKSSNSSSKLSGWYSDSDSSCSNSSAGSSATMNSISLLHNKASRTKKLIVYLPGSGLKYGTDSMLLKIPEMLHSTSSPFRSLRPDFSDIYTFLTRTLRLSAESDGLIVTIPSILPIGP